MKKHKDGLGRLTSWQYPGLVAGDTLRRISHAQACNARSMRWLLAVCMAAGMGLTGPQVSAQTLGQCAKEAAGCVVNVAKSAYYSVSAVGSALEFAALHPNCVADVVSGNPVTIGISSAIVGVAATGVISSTSFDSCKSSLYGLAAKPIASAISEIIPNDKIKKFAAEAGPDYVGDGFEVIASSIPTLPSVGAPNLSMQLVCGCAVASAGAGMVDNLKNALVTSAAAAESCSNTMGCLGGAALTALKDAGKAVGQVSVAVAKCAWTPNDCGESEAIPPDQYWTYNFAPFVPVYANLIVTESNAYCSSNSIYEYKTCPPSVELENKRTECLDYHKAHKAAASTARTICNPMRDRVTTEAQVIINRRMNDEIFPKKALEWAKKTFPLEGQGRYGSGDFEFCLAPTGIDTSKSYDLTGVSFYVGGAETLQVTTKCIDALVRSIGLDRNNNLVLNGDPGRLTLLADAKAKAAKSKWDFNNSFKSAYSTWTVHRNAIKSTYAPQVLKAAQEAKIYLGLNPVYAKSALAVYITGVAACPKFGEIGQVGCVRQMRQYMGLYQNENYDAPAVGIIDMSVWGSNPPKPYVSAMSLLQKVKSQNGNINESIDGAVSWAMDDARKWLTTIPAKAVASDKADLKRVRDLQTQQVSKEQDVLGDAYADARSRCKQSSCGPKIDEVRQTQKIAEGNLLKTLVTGIDTDMPFKGLASYLAGMKTLNESTRPKYKEVLDLERFVAAPQAPQGITSGVLAAAAAASAPKIAGQLQADKSTTPLINQGVLKEAGVPGPNAGVAAGIPKVAGQLPSGAANNPLDSRPVLNQAGGLPAVNSGIAAASPKPAAVAVPQARLGMPGLPTMGALPPPKAPATGQLPSAVPPPVAPPTATTPPVAVLPPPGNAGAGIVLKNQPPPGGSVPGVVAALAPPFDPRAFRLEREKAIGDEWLPQCKGNAACLQGMTVLINRRVDGEVQALTAGSPDYKNKPAVAAFIDKVDTQFDPQFTALIPKPAMVAIDPPVPPVTVIPKGVPKVNKIPGLK